MIRKYNYFQVVVVVHIYKSYTKVPSYEGILW
jgi:hypothetical protein